ANAFAPSWLRALAAAGYTGGFSPGRTLCPVSGTSAGYTDDADGVAENDLELTAEDGEELTGDRLGAASLPVKATTSSTTGKTRAKHRKNRTAAIATSCRTVDHHADHLWITPGPCGD